MKQTLFDAAVKAKLFQRLDQLTPETAPQWGVMNVCQMLHHLFMSYQAPLGEIQAIDHSTLFLRTIGKWFVLSGKVPSKRTLEIRQIRTFKEINVVKMEIPTADFQTEKNELKKIIGRFIRSEKLAPRHPMVGKMSKKNWGYWGYTHVNYHLTQFGVCAIVFMNLLFLL
jgi:hypothetical protein